MKLPRLSNPTRVTHVEHHGDETITTEIEYVSQFDLLPTWLQWALLSPLFIATVVLLIMTVTK